MKKMIIMGLAIIFFSGCDKSQKKYALKYEIGKKYQQESITKNVQNMNIGLGKEDMVMCQTQVYSMSVLAGTEAGGFIVELEWEKMGMGMIFGAQKISYDSSQKEASNNSLPDSVGLLIGSKIQVEFDGDYQVQKVKGVHELMNKILKLKGAEAQQTFKATFSEKTIKETLTQSMQKGLPGNNVVVGDSWSAITKKPLATFGIMKSDTTYKFDRSEKIDGYDCACFVHHGQLSMDGSSNDTPMNFEIDISDGISSGTTWFSREIGQIVQSVSTQTMAVAICVDGKTDNVKSATISTTKLLKITDI